MEDHDYEQIKVASYKFFEARDGEYSNAWTESDAWKKDRDRLWSAIFTDFNDMKKSNEDLALWMWFQDMRFWWTVSLQSCLHFLCYEASADFVWQRLEV